LVTAARLCAARITATLTAGLAASQFTVAPTAGLATSQFTVAPTAGLATSQSPSRRPPALAALQFTVALTAGLATSQSPSRRPPASPPRNSPSRRPPASPPRNSPSRRPPASPPRNSPSRRPPVAAWLPVALTAGHPTSRFTAAPPPASPPRNSPPPRPPASPPRKFTAAPTASLAASRLAAALTAGLAASHRHALPGALGRPGRRHPLVLNVDMLLIPQPCPHASRLPRAASGTASPPSTLRLTRLRQLQHRPVVLHEPTDAKQNRAMAPHAPIHKCSCRIRPVHPQADRRRLWYRDDVRCITGTAGFIGGVIMRSGRVGRLVRRTAKLPATELTPPARVIGRPDRGLYSRRRAVGAADAVDGLVRLESKRRANRNAHISIATGGLAGLRWTSTHKEMSSPTRISRWWAAPSAARRFGIGCGERRAAPQMVWRRWAIMSSWR